MSQTGDGFRYSYLAMAVRGALFSLGLATMTLPDAVLAQSGSATSAKAQAYSIPAGPMESALNDFARQTGQKLSFDAAEVKGFTTPGLTGNFMAQDGLNRLLSGSELEAIPEPGGYVIRRSTVAAQPAVLPAVKVAATPITGPTDGYMATKSFGATRTDTPLRDVPQSVTVVTKDQIRDQAMMSIADVVRYVPGVVTSQGEGNRDAVIFRGNNSTGDFYVDGLRDDVQYIRDLYNIDRVDVLKGSNGMIFGRGGGGGVINRVTKEAKWTPVSEIVAQYGSFSQKRIAVDIGRPINEVMAVRLNAMYEHSNSYRDGVDLERGGVNPTLTFKPTPQTKVVLSGEYFFDRRVADRGIPSFGTINGVANSGRPADTHWSTFFGNQDGSTAHIDTYALNSLIEHTFDNQLISVTVPAMPVMTSFIRTYSQRAGNGRGCIRHCKYCSV